MTKSKLDAAALTKNACLINNAHHEVIAATKNSLEHAMTAGEILKACKKTVGHGAWEKWLNDNCPEISEETARVYMRLAKNSDAIKKAAEQNGSTAAVSSVRGALKLIRKPQTPEQIAARRARRTAKAAGKTNAGIEDLLPGLAPDEVYEALKDAWDVEELNKLAELCASRAKQLLTASASEDLTIPEMFQRKPAPI